jgi:hypothetical protein
MQKKMFELKMQRRRQSPSILADNVAAVTFAMATFASVG